MKLFPKKEVLRSKVNISNLYPVGSVIKINNDSKLFMICDYKGFKKSEENKTNSIEIDYWCVEYPLGQTKESKPISIRQEDISKVMFQGYNSVVRRIFCKEMDNTQEQLEAAK